MAGTASIAGEGGARMGTGIGLCSGTSWHLVEISL